MKFFTLSLSLFVIGELSWGTPCWMVGDPMPRVIVGNEAWKIESGEYVYEFSIGKVKFFGVRVDAQKIRVPFEQIPHTVSLFLTSGDLLPNLPEAIFAQSRVVPSPASVRLVPSLHLTGSLSHLVSTHARVAFIDSTTGGRIKGGRINASENLEDQRAFRWLLEARGMAKLHDWNPDQLLLVVPPWKYGTKKNLSSVGPTQLSFEDLVNEKESSAESRNPRVTPFRGARGLRETGKDVYEESELPPSLQLRLKLQVKLAKLDDDARKVFLGALLFDPSWSPQRVIEVLSSQEDLLSDLRAVDERFLSGKEFFRIQLSTHHAWSYYQDLVTQVRALPPLLQDSSLEKRSPPKKVPNLIRESLERALSVHMKWLTPEEREIVWTGLDDLMRLRFVAAQKGEILVQGDVITTTGMAGLRAGDKITQHHSLSSLANWIRAMDPQLAVTLFAVVENTVSQVPELFLMKGSHIPLLPGEQIRLNALPISGDDKIFTLDLIRRVRGMKPLYSNRGFLVAMSRILNRNHPELRDVDRKFKLSELARIAKEVLPQDEHSRLDREAALLVRDAAKTSRVEPNFLFEGFNHQWKPEMRVRLEQIEQSMGRMRRKAFEAVLIYRAAIHNLSLEQFEVSGLLDSPEVLLIKNSLGLKAGYGKSMNRLFGGDPNSNEAQQLFEECCSRVIPFEDLFVNSEPLKQKILNFWKSLRDQGIASAKDGQNVLNLTLQVKKLLSSDRAVRIIDQRVFDQLKSQELAEVQEWVTEVFSKLELPEIERSRIVEAGVSYLVSRMGLKIREEQKTLSRNSDDRTPLQRLSEQSQFTTVAMQDFLHLRGLPGLPPGKSLVGTRDLIVARREKVSFRDVYRTLYPEEPIYGHFSAELSAKLNSLSLDTLGLVAEMLNRVLYHREPLVLIRYGANTSLFAKTLDLAGQEKILIFAPTVAGQGLTLVGFLDSEEELL